MPEDGEAEVRVVPPGAGFVFELRALDALVELEVREREHGSIAVRSPKRRWVAREPGHVECQLAERDRLALGLGERHVGRQVLLNRVLERDLPALDHHPQ